MWVPGTEPWSSARAVIKPTLQPMGVKPFNPNTWEAEAEASRVLDQLDLNSPALFCFVFTEHGGLLLNPSTSEVERSQPNHLSIVYNGKVQASQGYIMRSSLNKP